MKIFSIFLILISCFGCNSVESKHGLYTESMTSYKSKSSSNKAKVTFFRKGQFFGDAAFYSILAHDKVIGKLQSSTYFSREFKPGPITFKTNAEFGKFNELPMDLKAGKEYFVEGKVVPGVWVGRGLLIPSNRAVAEEYIKNSKAAKEDDGLSPTKSTKSTKGRN